MGPMGPGVGRGWVGRPPAATNQNTQGRTPQVNRISVVLTKYNNLIKIK